MLVLTDPRAPPGHVHRAVYTSEWVKRSLARAWDNRSGDLWTRDPWSDTWTKVPTATYGGSGAARVWHIEGQITLGELAWWFAAGKPAPSGARMDDPDGFICTTSNGDTPCPRPKKFCVAEGCLGFRTGTRYCYYHSSPAGRKALSRAGKVRPRREENAFTLKVEKVRACGKCGGYARGYESLWLEMEKTKRMFHSSIAWRDYLRPKTFEWLPRCDCKPPSPVATYTGEVSWCGLEEDLWRQRRPPPARVDGKLLRVVSTSDIVSWSPFKEIRPDDQASPDRFASMDSGDDEDKSSYEAWNNYSGDAAWQVPLNDGADGAERWLEKGARKWDYKEERRFRRHLASLTKNPARRPIRADMDDETISEVPKYTYDPQKWPEEHARRQKEIEVFRQAYVTNAV